MTKSNNRGWHKAWTWDVENGTAEHENALFVKFEAVGDDWRPVINEEHERCILAMLASETNATTAVRTLARLKREAVDGFAYAVKKHAYDTAKAQRAPLESGHV